METARKEIYKMQTVRLNGNIAKFGEVWETDCSNIRNIFKLIDCQTPGFRQYIINAGHAGIGFEIQKGSEFLEYSEEMLMSIGNEDIIITEVPAGSKSGGAKILAALAIAAMFFIPGTQMMLLNPGLAAGGGIGAQSAATYAYLGGVQGGAAAAGSLATASLTMPGLIAASVAVNLAMTGIAQMMAPGPEVDVGTKESYLFDGPDNAIEQGMAVPVCYGELIVGGRPISQSFRPFLKSYDTFGLINYNAGSGAAATIDPEDSYNDQDAASEFES